MRLPAGVTGFGHDLPVVDVVALQTACHRAAREIGGQVERCTEARYASNFHVVEIGYREQRFAVLCNAYFALLGIARPEDETDFLDPPELGSALAQVPDLHLLTAAELNAELSQADVADLRPVELKQIAYWQPVTVGEVVFNYWD